MKKIAYAILSFINFVFPKNSKMIVVYGRSMLNDNSEALLNYLVKKNYWQKYKLILLLRSGVKHSFGQEVNVVNNSVLTFYYCLRAKYVFHTHGMSFCSHRANSQQIIFNLWHGSPMKRIGVLSGEDVGDNKANSYFLCASPMFAEIIKKCFRLSDDQVFIGGNPRNDYLFVKKEIKKLLSLENCEKIIMFMPTFRQSKDVNRNDASKEFPILDIENIHGFDEYLKSRKTVLIIKPHPYQNSIGFLRQEFGNIKVLYNEDFTHLGLKLYEVLGSMDALLTDFSSVYFDYLVLDKPIGFTIDDYESYSSKRGYLFDNPLELMPGKKILNLNELKVFIDEIADGIDDYKEDRNRVNELCNTFITPDASERIVLYCGIQ